jgi:hypothetical protein
MISVSFLYRVNHDPPRFGKLIIDYMNINDMNGYIKDMIFPHVNNYYIHHQLPFHTFSVGVLGMTEVVCEEDKDVFDIYMELSHTYQSYIVIHGEYKRL